MDFEQRYSCLKEDSEIVLLKGTGCFWKQCTFCDYYLDSAGEEETVNLNEAVLERITGETGNLVVLNSGSYFELPEKTKEQVLKICIDKNIKELTIESHWLKRKEIVKLKEELNKKFGKKIRLHARIGIETFDEEFREKVLKKGMGYKVTPEEIAQYFDECCLLFGIEGQDPGTFISDLETAKKYFNQIYVNIFSENTKDQRASKKLIEWFKREALPGIENFSKITVLLNNTDLGVGN